MEDSQPLSLPQAGEAAYLRLHREGELADRAHRLAERLRPCRVCPHECAVDRAGRPPGRCRTGMVARVAAALPHFGEEPALAGEQGVGNVFFARCNLRCVYCQNWQISQSAHRGGEEPGRDVEAEELAGLYLALQRQGCRLLGWVSPSHVVPQAVEALAIAAERGLRLPIVYNSSAYDSVETLLLLDGIVDIYLPDLKYADNTTARRCSSAPAYVARSRAAITEMARQVGAGLRFDGDGLALRGLIVRHLILPNELAGTEASLRWLRSALGPGVHLSIMAQYFPTHRADGPASSHPLLTRRIRERELEAALAVVDELGFEHGWVQDPGAAPDSYRPDFSADAPFADARDLLTRTRRT